MLYPPVYNCPPPNEDLNDESYDAWLHVVENAKGHFITHYHHPNPENRTFYYQDAWDGVVMTQLLRKQKPLVAILETLQQQHWSLSAQKPLKKFLLDFFNNNYFQHIYNRDIKNAILFFQEHETYAGEYRTITRDMIPISNGNSEYSISSKSAGNLPTLEQYCGIENMRSGRLCFANNLEYVAQWCMNNFSYHREDWTWTTKFEVIDIASLPEKDAEILEEEKKKQKLTKQERLDQKLNAMTPEERRSYISGLKLSRKISTLKRSGKIDSEVDEILGLGE